MEKDDPQWIQDNSGDTVDESGEKFAGTFEGTVFMSTDGKHTVSIKSDTPAGRRDGMKWMKQVYERLMTIYGSKQEYSAKEYKKAEGNEGLGRCEKCNASMKMSTRGKPYCGKLCWKK